LLTDELECAPHEHICEGVDLDVRDELRIRRLQLLDEVVHRVARVRTEHESDREACPRKRTLHQADLLLAQVTRPGAGACAAAERVRLAGSSEVVQDHQAPPAAGRQCRCDSRAAVRRRSGRRHGRLHAQRHSAQRIAQEGGKCGRAGELLGAAILADGRRWLIVMPAGACLKPLARLKVLLRSKHAQHRRLARPRRPAQDE
jgi:hypothetical protein